MTIHPAHYSKNSYVSKNLFWKVLRTSSNAIIQKVCDIAILFYANEKWK